MKLNRFYLSDKTVAEINEIVDNLHSVTEGTGVCYDKLREVAGYPDRIGSINAEIVTDGDGNIYDIRIFDPYNQVGTNTSFRNFDGWTYWEMAYEDNNGNTIDEIFEDFGGETQDEIR